MIMNDNFKSFIRSWFSEESRDFAEDIINNPANHENWLIGLWYSYIHENAFHDVGYSV